MILEAQDGRGSSALWPWRLHETGPTSGSRRTYSYSRPTYPIAPQRLPRDRWLPPIDDLTRRELLAGAVALLVGAACGTDEQPAAAPSPTATTRTIDSIFGPVEVTVAPARVVAADPYVSLPTALAAGVPVVGASHLPFGDPFPPFLDEAAVAGIENVGWTEINVERVAALRPDLIVGMQTFLEKPYGQLIEIAPTVVVPTAFTAPWKENVRFVARALGAEDRMEHQVRSFEGRVRDFKQAMGGRLNQLEVSLVNIRAMDDIRIYSPRFCSGQVLEEAGLRRPVSQRQGDEFATIKLSIERLQEADADAIFYFVGSTGGDPAKAAEQAETIRSHPLWGRLRAVQSGSAYPVDLRWWFSCGSLQAAHRIVDDLFTHLVK